jgi:hypothetical protein
VAHHALLLRGKVVVGVKVAAADAGADDADDRVGRILDGGIRNGLHADIARAERGIAEAVDTLAAKTLRDLQRSVKWGMSYYGVGDGWCFSCGGFVGHVKLMFINGAALDPVPPVTPVGMGKSTRGVELGSVDDLDERQIAAWMKQVASVPGVGGRKP